MGLQKAHRLRRQLVGLFRRRRRFQYLQNCSRETVNIITVIYSIQCISYISVVVSSAPWSNLPCSFIVEGPEDGSVVDGDIRRVEHVLKSSSGSSTAVAVNFVGDTREVTSIGTKIRPYILFFLKLI